MKPVTSSGKNGYFQRKAKRTEDDSNSVTNSVTVVLHKKLRFNAFSPKLFVVH